MGRDRVTDEPEVVGNRRQAFGAGEVSTRTGHSKKPNPPPIQPAVRGTSLSVPASGGRIA